jgi:hypothetical protein
MLWWFKLIILLTIAVAEAKKNQFKTSQILLLLLLLFTTPVFWSHPDNLRVAALVTTTVLWLSYRLITNPALKIFFLGLMFVTVIFSSLYFNGVISSDFHLDRERLFYVNSRYDYHIHRFQEWSTYLPFSWRPVIFGPWIIFTSLIGRGLSFFWFDQTTSTIGFIAVIPFLMGLLKSRQLIPLIVMFMGVSAGSLSRNPDTSTIYLLLFPPLLTYISQGLKYFP